jgi:hypothetical protein
VPFNDRIVHQRQARVVADDHAIGRDADHRRQNGAQLGQALQLAVVADVDGARHHIALAGQIQEFIRQIELFRRRFAARQIQLHTAFRERVVLLLDLGMEAAQLIRAQRWQVRHRSVPIGRGKGRALSTGDGLRATGYGLR